MRCGNHPDREAAACCQKHGLGFCRECCDCADGGPGCAACVDPEQYCTFRTQCIIPEIARQRRGNRLNPPPAGF